MPRTVRQRPRRRRPYRSTPLHRHRARVRWLVAQRFRTRNYLRRFGNVGSAGEIDPEGALVPLQADIDDQS
ncbi:hypothetical protein [Microbulbifer sp. SAOS-129_SWC]|uniref:hypothetical protein n=1 Tax=Microbulbifer sp. SAOS-129_SWC TaxID=3145235 RepID=UPI003217B19D